MHDDRLPTEKESDLQRIYRRRFQSRLNYRNGLWRIVVEDFFQTMIPRSGSVLDLGCGYGEFINHVIAKRRYAMDLNPDIKLHLNEHIELLCQDCTKPWNIAPDSLDVVFSSNFFEHIPDKELLGKIFLEIFRCLKPGGTLIAMGPNAKVAPGAYWDFWDHHIPLSELSLKEALETRGFTATKCIARFLPYTMSGWFLPPLICVRLYLRMPFAWNFFGGQFLVVARRNP
jgi:SAM-dependent methyltransferase